MALIATQLENMVVGDILLWLYILLERSGLVESRRVVGIGSKFVPIVAEHRKASVVVHVVESRLEIVERLSSKACQANLFNIVVQVQLVHVVEHLMLLKGLIIEHTLWQ